MFHIIEMMEDSSHLFMMKDNIVQKTVSQSLF